MAILITGHKGFIGSHLFYKLRSGGHDVVGVDAKDAGGNIMQTNFGDPRFKDVDVVVHLAANLYDDFEDNAISTNVLLSYFPDARFIFTSSAAVYGNNPNATEDDETFPFGDYGKTKFLEEQRVNEFTEMSTIFRLSNVYGYGTDHGFHHLCTHNRVRYIPYPDHIRDYVHVDGVVWAIEQAIFEPRRWWGVFNIGSGVGIRNIDLYRLICGDPKDVVHKRIHCDEISVSILNIDKAKKNGYVPCPL